jgi:hypothetical protein
MKNLLLIYALACCGIMAQDKPEPADEPDIQDAAEDTKPMGERPPEFHELMQHWFSGTPENGFEIRGWKVGVSKLWEMDGDWAAASFSIEERAPVNSGYLPVYYSELHIFFGERVSFDLIHCKAQGDCEKPSEQELKTSWWEEPVGSPAYTTDDNGNHWTEQKIRFHGVWSPTEIDGSNGVCAVNQRGWGSWFPAKTIDECFSEGTTSSLARQ